LVQTFLMNEGWLTNTSLQPSPIWGTN